MNRILLLSVVSLALAVFTQITIGSTFSLFSCMGVDYECATQSMTCESGVPCIVACGYEGCKESNIDGNGATSLIVICGGWEACKNANIICATGVECAVECGDYDKSCGCKPDDQPWPCSDALTIDATTASSVSVTGANAGHVLLLTSPPTTSLPTTVIPTTALPTTAIPTTALPTTAIPTTPAPTRHDNDDDEDEDSSGGSSDDTAAAALFGGKNIDNDENVSTENVVINFSRATAMNIFAIVCVTLFCVVVVVYYFCVKNETKGKAEFVDNV